MEKWLGSFTEMKNDRKKKLKKTIAFTHWTNFFEQNFKKKIFYCSDDFFEHFLKKRKLFPEWTIFLNKRFSWTNNFYWTNDYTYWTIVKWETNYDENEWYFWERPKSIVMNYYIKKETKSAIHERWSIFVKSMI